MIEINDLNDRGVYKLNSRNLDFGAWISERNGFIGIREKFGYKLLDTEFYYGPTSGTAKPIEYLDIVVPEDIILDECIGLVCSCGRTAEKTGIEYNPKAEKQGPYDKHSDDGSLIDLFDPEHEVYWVSNKPLLNFLEEIERNL